MAAKNTSARGLASLWAWLLDQCIEHWPTIVSLLAGVAMTFLASITEWLKEYGPVVWGGVGLVSALIVSVIYLVYSAASRWLAMRNYAVGKLEASSVGVLAPIHDYEKINLSDFYNPFFEPTENVRFANCDIFGPALVLQSRCTFNESKFVDCEIVITRSDRPIKGAMAFSMCTFFRCRLYRVTFGMSDAAYKTFPDDLKASIRVISDGRIGDV